MKTQDHHEAMLWESAGDGRVKCRLCGHGCVIDDGGVGLCRVRRNVGGTLQTLNYHSVVAANVDPIEKKPLYHVLPGSMSLSIAAPGCNFRCGFCQNWQISQVDGTNGLDAGQPIDPDSVVSSAERYHCRSISYTYTEPTIFFELAYDCAVRATAKGLRNVFVSNGFMTTEAVETIAPYLDAINVDLKAFRDRTYREVMKARLDPVLESLRAWKHAGVWVEVTTLIVPGMNDDEQELRDMAAFLTGELGPGTPWHLSRFHGDYTMAETPTTPLETMQRARQIGWDAGLEYVYLGNVLSEQGGDTVCPDCQTVLIQRRGLPAQVTALTDGRCTCGREIPGLWS
jgi:pyruvate formate lyase activating enzyme